MTSAPRHWQEMLWLGCGKAAHKILPYREPWLPVAEETPPTRTCPVFTQSLVVLQTRSVMIDFVVAEIQYFHGCPSDGCVAHPTQGSKRERGGESFSLDKRRADR